VEEKKGNLKGVGTQEMLLKREFIDYTKNRVFLRVGRGIVTLVATWEESSTN